MSRIFIQVSRICLGRPQDSRQKFAQKSFKKWVQKLIKGLVQWELPGFCPGFILIRKIEKKKSWAVFWTMKFAGAIVCPHKSCASHDQNTLSPYLPSPLHSPLTFHLPSSLPPSLSLRRPSYKPSPPQMLPPIVPAPFPLILPASYFDSLPSRANPPLKANPMPEPT